MRTIPGLRLAVPILAMLALPATQASFAGDFVGPNDCTSCHDHERATKAWEASKHSRSLDIFEGAKADEFLKKLGLKDPYSDFCTGCHASMVDGQPDYGVSCESCHGGASAFLKPHQTKGSYEQAISLGMLRTKDLAVRAKNCVSCHIVRDKRLLNIGHPDGSKFDIVKFSDQINHWDETHSPAEIAQAGKTAIEAMGGAPAPIAKATPPPAPAKTVEKPVPPPSKPAEPTPTPAPAKQATAEPLAKPARPAQAPALPGLPPDEPWPSNQPTLDSIASLQARLIQVLNAMLAEKGIKAGANAVLDPPDPSAKTPEARLIDLQRRILALQRRLIESAGR